MSQPRSPQPFAEAEETEGGAADVAPPVSFLDRLLLSLREKPPTAAGLTEPPPQEVPQEVTGARLPASTADLVEELIREGQLLLTSFDGSEYALTVTPAYPFVRVICRPVGSRFAIALNDNTWGIETGVGNIALDQRRVAAAVLCAIGSLPEFWRFRCGMAISTIHTWPFPQHQQVLPPDPDVPRQELPLAGCPCTYCEGLRDQGLPEAANPTPVGEDVPF